MTEAAPTPIQSTVTRAELIRAGSLHWVHWVVIVTSLTLTVGAWKYSDFQVTQKIEERFHREADQLAELVVERMELYEYALWGGVAYIDANGGQTTLNEWLTYSESLQIDKAYPGINGIGVIYNIEKNELEAYLKYQAIDRPSYGIHPSHQESEYWPITYIEPVAANTKAVGLDMAFEANRYSGILKARDTGLAQLTKPIILVQDEKKTPGFLLYAPFYKKGVRAATVAQRRELIIGVTYAPFIMYKLMEGTLAKQKRLVSVKITDAGDLLYDDAADKEGVSGIDPNPMFKKTTTTEFYGRTWTFETQSNLQFRSQTDLNQPYIILMAGILIDALIISLFIFLTRANRKALAYADEMTTELEVKAIHLEKSNEDLEQFAFIASHDLKSPLSAIEKLVSWIEEDCEDVLPESSKDHLIMLRQRCNRMTKLLDDLLAYAKIGKMKDKPTAVALKAMVDDVALLLDKPEGFSLTATDMQLFIPSVPFELVLRNLVSNAIKHHDKGSGEISIECVETPGFYRISVTDDGPGIPLNLQGKAVEMFQTLQPRDKVEGSGMGLSMVNRIVDHYKGEFRILSDSERGTRIEILWPTVAR